MIAAFTLSLLGTLSLSRGHAQEPADNFWRPLRGREVRRCEAHSSAWEKARASLDQLALHVTALDDYASPAPAVQELLAVLQTPCFQFAMESPRLPEPDTGLSMKRWWEDGGSSWLRSYLKLPELGEMNALRRHVVVPPDTRRTLGAGDAGREFADLLCPAKDAGCAADTSGWRSRAEAFIALHRARERANQAALDDSAKRTSRPAWAFDGSPEEIAHGCEREAARVDRTARYLAWRSCLEGYRREQWTLPLGRLRAPATGWLVVAGRRGHYSFCDAIGAYDIATGAAYIQEVCSDLALVPGGTVDQEATRRAARHRSLVGTLRVDNLREALWALLLMKEAEQVQDAAEYYPLPRGWQPAIPANAEWDSGSFSSGMWGRSGQTRLNWRWVRPEGTKVAGELIWPQSWNAVEEHAAGLLEASERSLVGGCPPAAPPPVDIVTTVITVNPRDEVPDIDKDLIEGFHRWRAAPPCPARSQF